MARKYTCSRCGATGHGKDDCGASRNPLSGPMPPTSLATKTPKSVGAASFKELHEHFSAMRDEEKDAGTIKERENSKGEAQAIKDKLRCAACGQFVAADSSHSCWQRKLMKFTPGIQLAGTAAVTSIAFALGPPAVAALGAVALGGLFLRTFVLKKLLSRSRKPKGIRTRSREAAKVQDMAENLMQEMGVEGTVEVEVSNKGKMGQAANAGALRSPSGHHTIIINQGFLELSADQQEAIIAHEVAHLQTGNKNFFRAGVRAAALPAGLAAGAIATSAAGMGALSGGAIAAAAWLAVLLGSTALSRREERRADREAHKAVGDKFPNALKALSEKSYGSVRGDKPWRVEDLFSTHGNLPNRLSDMEKAKA